jgi:F-type H+-transporting ATPase subunit a
MDNSSILNLKIYRLLLISAFFLIAGLFPKSAFCSENTADSAKKPYDAKATILEHIGDSHVWPVIADKSLPLPIIVYTAKGLESFSSGKMMPEGTIYKGEKYSYKLEENKIKIVDASGAIDESATKKLLDFSITRNVASMFMAIAILLIVFLSVAGAYKKSVGKAPKGLQSFLEPVILFVRDDIAIPNIGSLKAHRFLPLLLTIFFFILINNLFGMIPFFPGGYNLTGNIAVTAVLSVIIFFVVNLNGNKHYWKHIFVPNPWWLFFIMIPVEIVGIFTKPIALMIRLFANITAGHILILSLISLIFIFKTIAVSPVSVVFVVFMDTIELLVAFLQAYIFTLLASLFIGMAIEEHHSDHAEVL